MTEHGTFMLEAIRLAKSAMDDGGGEPFGGVVVKDGEIVGRGRNQAFARRTPTAHAELLAVDDACAELGTDRLDGCVVYASGQPCMMCVAAMILVGIGKIYYANTHEQIGYDPRPGVAALCGAYGAEAPADVSLHGVPGLEIIHLPMREAGILAVPKRGF